jgi:hypothetical protein
LKDRLKAYRLDSSPEQSAGEFFYPIYFPLYEMVELGEFQFFSVNLEGRFDAETLVFGHRLDIFTCDLNGYWFVLLSQTWRLKCFEYQLGETLLGISL